MSTTSSTFGRRSHGIFRYILVLPEPAIDRLCDLRYVRSDWYWKSWSYALWLHAELSGPPVFEFNDRCTNCPQQRNAQLIGYFIIYPEDDFLRLVDVVNLQGAFLCLHWSYTVADGNVVFSDLVAAMLPLDWLSDVFLITGIAAPSRELTLLSTVQQSRNSVSRNSG